MVAIACSKCQNLLVLMDFEATDTRTVKLELYCVHCETGAEVSLDMLEFAPEPDEWFGNYL